MSGTVGFIDLDGQLHVSGRGLFWNSRRRAEESEYPKITQVKFNDNVTQVAPMAMAGIGATTVIVPDTVWQIGAKAFKKCPNLKKLELPATLTQLPIGACAECENLESVEFSEKLTDIEDKCFDKCGKLKFVLPDGIQRLGTQAFYGTANTELTLPKSLKVLGPKAFACMADLQRLVIEDKNLKFPRDVFIGCKKLTEVRIGKQEYKVVFYDGTPLLRRGETEVIHGVNVTPVSYIGDCQILYMARTSLAKTRNANKKAAVEKVRADHMYIKNSKMLDGVADLTIHLNISFQELFCLKQAAILHGDNTVFGMSAQTKKSVATFDCDRCLKNMPEIYRECCRRYGLDKVK